MARVIWTPQALTDLDAICLFIARDAPLRAEALADQIFRRPDGLEDFPRMGKGVPEYEREDLREILVSAYRVLYLLLGDDVYIVTIHHAARPLGDLGL